MTDVTRGIIAELIEFEGHLEVVDIGAALLGAPPPYQALLARGLGRLSAFDADERQRVRLQAAYGDAFSLHPEIVGDGEPGTLHLAAAASGMSSLLKPSQRHLEFFNEFERFGQIHETLAVTTTRLDDVAGLPDIDFLKMDIQGGELAVLQHGGARLARCVAIQLEVSFVPLYEKQPSFGEVDVWMRSQGFLPHAFAELKRWSIAPVRRDNDARVPFNQLLEADAVYVRDPTAPEVLDDDMLRRLILVAHYAYSSFDLAGRLVTVLRDRGSIAPDAFEVYMAIVNAPELDA